MGNKREIEQIKVRLRSVFKTPLGRWGLGYILENLCKFSVPATDEDIASRQSVGKELLCQMDMWFGEGQSNNSEKFVNKLFTEIEETRSRRKKE